MIFMSYNSASCGSTFLGADVFTLPCTPTDVNHINKVELYNARFDDLYVSNDINDEAIEENSIPDNWDFQTIMKAQFDGDTSAGNVNWHLDELSHIIIKVKPQDDYKWITCHVKAVNGYDDLVIVGRYLAATTGVWDVALVPITSGTIEGTYVQTKVNVDVNKLVLIDEDNIHSTFLIDGSVSIQSVMPNQAVDTLHNKFPYIIRNTSKY